MLVGEAEQSAELGLRLKGWQGGAKYVKISVMPRAVFPANIGDFKLQKVGSFTTNTDDNSGFTNQYHHKMRSQNAKFG